MILKDLRENLITYQITEDQRILLVPHYTTRPTSESTQAFLEELGSEGAKFLEKRLREKLGISVEPPVQNKDRR